MRVRPGGIINVSEYNSYIQFYEASLIANLEAETPFIGPGELHPVYLRSRGVFSYGASAYEGHIHTPTEDLLTWEPMAFTISLIALGITVAAWVIR
jgi:hypothetical protein